jgi:molybdenum cofactor cytidylyltransferase
VRVQGLLLAAGRSRRFGRDKLLEPVRVGEAEMPMALASARALAPAVDALLAVVPPGDAPVAGLLGAAGFVTAACDHEPPGMGWSLAAGVAASPDADAWLVALADMPWLAPATACAVAAALRAGAPLAAPLHGGHRGHPVGLSARYRERLLALAGDQGARALLADAGAALQPVPVDDPGSLRDVDLPAEL